MSHPIDPPVPPSPALLGDRLHRATVAAAAGQYEPTTAARLRDDALALAIAAGLGDEHRLLAELDAARAAGDHARVAKLAGELSARIAAWGVGASDSLWRADRDASARGQR
jgi:hypothetical protein